MVTKRSHILKQTCSWKVQVCLSMCDLFLPPGIKGLNGLINLSMLFWKMRSVYFTNHVQKSRPKVFLGKGVLKICSKLTGEHPCRNVHTHAEQLITLPHGCSPVNLLHIFRTSFPKNTASGPLYFITNE